MNFHIWMIGKRPVRIVSFFNDLQTSWKIFNDDISARLDRISGMAGAGTLHRTMNGMESESKKEKDEWSKLNYFSFVYNLKFMPIFPIPQYIRNRRHRIKHPLSSSIQAKGQLNPTQSSNHHLHLFFFRTSSTHRLLLGQLLLG